MIPIPFQIVWGFVLLCIGAVTVSAGVDAARERRRRPRHPISSNPQECWSDWDSVAEAMASGCCVTADAVPMGPIPAFLSSQQDGDWFDRWTFYMGDDGAIACPRTVEVC